MARKGRVAGRRTWPRGDERHDGGGGRVSASVTLLSMRLRHVTRRHHRVQKAAD